MIKRKIYWAILLSIMVCVNSYPQDFYFNSVQVSQSAYIEKGFYIEYSLPDLYSISHFRAILSDSLIFIAVGGSANEADISFGLRFNTSIPIVQRFDYAAVLLSVPIYCITTSVGILERQKYNISLLSTITILDGDLTNFEAYKGLESGNFVQIGASGLYSLKLNENFTAPLMLGGAYRSLSNRNYTLMNANFSISFKF